MQYYRNNKGCDTKKSENQQFPNPEPVMNWGSHSAAAADSCYKKIFQKHLRFLLNNLPVLSVASPMKNMEIPKETYKPLNI